jgi:tRNA nucleotidyltransferase (CCA-adding enzyme)
LSASLASPFATAYPPLLLASATATQAITVTDWPRVAYHRSELLKGLAICWCRIDAEQQKSKDLKNVQEMIEQATRLLTSVLERDVDVDVAAEYQILIDSEPRLQSLLVL